MSYTEYQSVPCLRTYGTCDRCGAQQSKWVNNPPEAYGTLVALSDKSDIYGLFELAWAESSQAVDKIDAEVMGLARIVELERIYGVGSVIQSLLGILADTAPDGGCWHFGMWPRCGVCGSRVVDNVREGPDREVIDIDMSCITFSEWLTTSPERLALILPDVARRCEVDVRDR